MHLLSEKGTIMSCGPFAILYKHTMYKVPELRGASDLYLYKFALSFAGGALLRIVHCFPTFFAVVARQKIGLNDVNSHVQ